MEPEEQQGQPAEYAPNVLVVMARGSSQGLWRAVGGEVSVKDLAIPGDLATRLGEWSRAFSQAVKDDSIPDRQAVLASFSAEGLCLAREVQASLGEAYEILFFDEAKLEADGYLTEYLYPAGGTGQP